MTINFDLVALLDFLAFVQGTLLGILLMLKKKEHISYFFLGLFLFTYSSELIVSVLFDTDIFPQKPSLLYLPATFYLTFMPALYLYVKSLSKAVNWKRYGWLLLPRIIEVIGFLVLFFQPTATKLNQFENGITYWFYSNFVDIAMVYTIIYALVILKLIQNHQKQVKDFYSNAKGKLLNWIQWICIIIIAINLLLLSSNFLAKEFWGNFIYPTVSALNVVFIFWIALSGFRQKVVDLPASKNIDLKSLPSNEEAIKITAPASDTSDAEYQKLVLAIQKEKIFTESDLHLANLAQKLSISQRHLSELINQKAGVNFNQFINHFRVEEAKKLLVDKKYAHLNILGIGFEVGFNSKTAFYTAFKKETGLTPAKFQKKTRIKAA